MNTIACQLKNATYTCVGIYIRLFSSYLLNVQFCQFSCLYCYVSNYLMKLINVNNGLCRFIMQLVNTCLQTLLFKYRVVNVSYLKNEQLMTTHTRKALVSWLNQNANTQLSVVQRFPPVCWMQKFLESWYILIFKWLVSKYIFEI